MTTSTKSNRITKLLSHLRSSEQGDVPGWVLITLMTAGIVVALWAVASPALGHLFDTAITRVVSF